MKNTKKKKKGDKRKVRKATISTTLVKSAVSIARKIDAGALFVYGDTHVKLDVILKDKLPFKTIIVSANTENVKRYEKLFTAALQLPALPLTRSGQIKISIIMAISGKIITPRDRVVFVTGQPGHWVIDSVVLVDVPREFSLLASPEMRKFTTEVDHTIFEQLVRLAIEIANEGREGHPVGTIFILGDTREVAKHVEQMIINPFKGHTEEKRQILNPEVQEVMKELSQLDGAFIIRPNGVVETAGAYIAAKMVPESLPQGLGARHYSAAAITAATNAIAVTVSQSTGDVYIFKGGKIITCIEKLSS